MAALSFVGLAPSFPTRSLPIAARHLPLIVTDASLHASLRFDHDLALYLCPPRVILRVSMCVCERCCVGGAISWIRVCGVIEVGYERFGGYVGV